MCLVIVGYQVNPIYPVIIALNRDEFYRRPTEPMHWWDFPLLAGKDLVKGGTYFGITRQGRWGVVTNFREKKGLKGEISRGEVLKRYLTQEWDLAQVEQSLPMVSGVNLLLSDGQKLWYLSNRAQKKELIAGLYVLSNGVLGDLWYKVRRAWSMGKNLIDSQDFSLNSWFTLLLDRKKAPFWEKLPKTGYSPVIERWLSSIYIKSPYYGTRSSYFALRDAGGTWLVHEKFHVPPLGLQSFIFAEN